MRRQDKTDTHDPKDIGVHAIKTKAPYPQPAKTTIGGKPSDIQPSAAPDEKEARKRHPALRLDPRPGSKPLNRPLPRKAAAGG
jgi:hypothetical protein